MSAGGQWRRADIYRALNLLVDESLKRVVWRHQQEAAHDELDFDIAWWAPHAPEPITLTNWLREATETRDFSADTQLVILHPDPPLGPEEKAVLEELLSLSGLDLELDVLTPRLLAARNG
jgi:hypothetical protein